MNWKSGKGKLKINNKKNDVLLVTGANGFIGRRLIPEIENCGYEAFFIDKVMPKACLKNSRLNFIVCDITKKTDVKKLKGIKDRLTLIHLAACVPRVLSAEKKMRDDIFKINIGGTINLLEGIKNKLSKVCYASTLEVYGTPAYLPIDEKHPVAPASLYGLSKLYAENYIKGFCLGSGIPYSILRFSSVYGPGENYNRAIPNFIKAAVKNGVLKIYGDGSELRDYLYVDDAVKALLLSAGKPNAEGVFNIASGSGISIRNIARLITKLCGSKAKIKFYKRRKEKYDLIFNISKAKRNLGFSPTIRLEKGLLEEIEWFKQQ